MFYFVRDIEFHLIHENKLLNNSYLINNKTIKGIQEFISSDSTLFLIYIEIKLFIIEKNIKNLIYLPLNEDKSLP